MLLCISLVFLAAWLSAEDVDYVPTALGIILMQC